jgi:hypothetical protein
VSAEPLRERLLAWADRLYKAQPFYEEEEFAEEARTEEALLREAVERLDRLEAWHESSVVIVAAFARAERVAQALIYDPAVNVVALVEKARTLNEAET